MGADSWSFNCRLDKLELYKQNNLCVNVKNSADSQMVLLLFPIHAKTKQNKNNKTQKPQPLGVFPHGDANIVQKPADSLVKNINYILGPGIVVTTAEPIKRN